MPGLGDLIDVIMNFGKYVKQWYSEMVVAVVRMMLNSSIPGVQSMSEGFMPVLLGGTFGLANLLVTFVVAILTVLILPRLRKDHSMKISRLFTSLIGLVLFSLVFYRGYGILYGLREKGTDLLVRFVTGVKTVTADDLAGLISAVEPLSDAFTGFFAWFFTWVTFIEGGALAAVFVLCLLAYPILLILRPLGGVFNVFFHLANAAIFTTLIAPFLMALFTLTPIWLPNIIPGASIFGGGSAIVGGLLAVFSPVGVFLAFLVLSNKIFGSVDARIAGAVDISSMPIVNMEDVNNSVTESSTAAFNAPAASAPAEAPSNFMSEVKGATIAVAAVAATSTGHPILGATVKGADSAATSASQKIRSDAKGNR